MKVRGERECKSCGTRWSYYETGSIECPSCGSVRSVGVDERTVHTAGAAELDLSEPRRRLASDAPTREVATAAADAASEFVRQHGFVSAGDLQPLDDEFVAAVELRHVGTELGREMRVDPAEEEYFSELFRGVEDGDRPAADRVPESLRGAHGLAMAAAVEAYHRDLKRVREEFDDPLVTRALSTVRDQRKRIEALDGEVDPKTADRIVALVQDLSLYLATDDEPALVRAQERLDLLD